VKVLGFAVLAAAVVGVIIFRRKVSPPRTDANLDEWWPANYPYAVMTWALAEGGGLFGLTIGWLTQDTILYISGVVVGVLLLIWCRPGSLEARR
jgi:hypothetical protein